MLGIARSQGLRTNGGRQTWWPRSRVTVSVACLGRQLAAGPHSRNELHQNLAQLFPTRHGAAARASRRHQPQNAGSEDQIRGPDGVRCTGQDSGSSRATDHEMPLPVVEWWIFTRLLYGRHLHQNVRDSARLSHKLSACRGLGRGCVPQHRAMSCTTSAERLGESEHEP